MSEIKIGELDLKKAVVGAVILYALSFLVACILMQFFPTTSATFEGLMMILGIALTYMVAKMYYFKDRAARNPAIEGMMLGIVFAAVMFVFEAVIMVYGFAKAQGWAYFDKPMMLIGYLLTIVVPILAGYGGKRVIRAKRRRR